MSGWRTAWSMVGRWLVFVPNPEGGEEQFSLPEHMKAEAFVIGAAHDLLGALKNLAGQAGALSAFEEEIREAAGNTNWQCLADAIERADAAIAKAKAQVKA